MNELSSPGSMLLAEGLRTPPAFMAALPMGMYACDAEGQILWFNKRAELLWGRTPVLGPEGDRYCGSYRILSPSGDSFISAGDAPMGEALRDGRSISGREVSIERPDGTRGTAIVHIEVVKDNTGQVLGAINCFQDVSDIKAREKRFDDILNSLPVAVYTTDSSGRVSYFNQAAEKLAGRTPKIGADEWCVTWRLYDADGNFLPHDQCPMAVALKEQREVRGVRAFAEKPDGSRVPFAPYPTPLRDSAGNMTGAVNALVDLTELDSANEQIRQRTKDILDFFENGAIALHLVASDGTITIANQAELDLLGYTKDEYIGRNIKEFHADQDVIAEILRKLSSGQKLDKYPARLIAKDGSIKHVLITSNVQFKDGEFVHTRCFTYDITQSKIAEAELYRHHQRLAATYEGAAVGIAETDADGGFIRVNEAMCSITGYSRRELLQQRLFDRLHPDEREKTLSRYDDMVQGRIKTYEIDKRFIHKSGHTIWIAGTCTAVRDENGRFLFGVRIVQDVTARKALYRFTEDLNAASDLQAVYASALDAVTSSLRCQRASVLLFDDHGQMKFVAQRGLSQKYRDAVAGHSPWTRDAQEPQPIFVADIEKFDIHDDLRTTVRTEGISALAFIPLAIDGKIIGKFMAYWDEPRRFDPEDAALAMAVAQQLSLAIARHETLQALIRTNTQISKDAEALARLNRASSRLWRCSHLVDGLEAILEGAIETVGATLGNVQLLDRDRQVLTIAVHKGFKQQFLDHFREVSAADTSVCGRALNRAERIIVGDVEHDEGSAAMREIARSAGFRAVQSTPLIGRGGQPLGVLSTHFDKPHVPSDAELRLLDLYARQAADFIERCHIDEALKVSEAQERHRASELQAIMEAVPNPIWIARDPNCRTILGNPAAGRLLGMSPSANHSFSVIEGERPTTYEIWSHGQRLEADQMPVQRAARGEDVRDLEMDIVFTDGATRSLLGNAAPLRDEEGKIRGGVAAFVDITERLRSEKQRELLTAELSHRVKNTLATVVSVLHHSYAKAPNPEAARKSFEARLLALAQTHTRLGDGEWTGVSFTTLIEDELAPYLNDDKSNLVISGPNLIVGPRAAVTLGMAFHELATNAAKYGALSTSAGEVEVYWNTDGSAVHIDWIERNGPKVSIPTRRGFGRFLIERGVARDFNGRVELQFMEEGLRCRMTLPLDSLKTLQQVSP
jgi:PAS domain S-box-containing protein